MHRDFHRVCAGQLFESTELLQERARRCTVSRNDFDELGGRSLFDVGMFFLHVEQRGNRCAGSRASPFAPLRP
jgi:hypothetical protein